MLRVPQTKLPQHGNSLQACIASILELPLTSIPSFEEDRLADWIAAKKWLNNCGYNFDHRIEKPEGYSIAVGSFTLDINVRHYVVALDGDIIYDPHPEQAGLIKIDRYWLIKPFNTTQDLTRA